MSTDKLRRELEALKQRSGKGGCRQCGLPGPPPANARVAIRVRRVEGPEDQESPAAPERCETCGRPKRVIKVRGLETREVGF